MITCVLKGGLGNMMFQIAALEYMASKNNTDAYYFNADQNLKSLNEEVIHNPSLSHANEYLSIFKNFSWRTGSPPTQMINVPFEYQVLPFVDGVGYNGFFQSEKYFPDRELIIKLFQPADWIEDGLEKYKEVLEGNVASIHVRRGDYLKFSHIHQTRNIEYYEEAMSIVNANKYLVFSDDIEWCKENFKGDQFTFVSGGKDYFELFLMSRCKHNIMGSSSFSWWGAWLNQNHDKIVVAPKKYLADNTNIIETDVIPESYNKI